MPFRDEKVHISVRYTRWAQFVLSVASVLHRVPVVGYPLMRLVYCACWFQIRTASNTTTTGWRWLRVPYPTPTIESEQA